MQRLAAVQETLLSKLYCAPLGSGVVWTDHVVPFQRSASVLVLPALSAHSPTAVHRSAERHDTPLNRAMVAPAGDGTSCTAQVVPFHASANGTTALEASVYDP